ncbi:hypothetical protein BC829DRAFT_445650 [Chytridium lagenaria]|nr:hypothetical protein BC829DRAFT_445650 [Chytridium lagenaria]
MPFKIVNADSESSSTVEIPAPVSGGLEASPSTNRPPSASSSSDKIELSLAAHFSEVAANTNPSSPILLSLPPPSPPEEDEDDILNTMSTEDLRYRLKEALATIREKERDLIIAAEIGQQLVAANTSLVSEYKDLLSRGPETTSPRTIPIPKHSYHHEPPSSPSSEPAALKASKRASMNLSMSRLDIEDVVMDGQPGTPPSNEDVRTLNSVPEDGEGKVGGMAGGSEGRTERSIKRKSSTGVYEYVASLERANAELREQLTVAVQNLQDADRVHKSTVTSLRRANSNLQDQLRSTLQDLRDAERSHGTAVASLEADLEHLRSDLSSASIAAQELESERRRLIRERHEAAREAQGVEMTDTMTIQDLQKRLRDCEGELVTARTGRREAERKFRGAMGEVERLRESYLRLEEGAREIDGLKEVCGRLEVENGELREQLEEMRVRWMDRSDVVALQQGGARGELAMVLAEATGKPEWEWTPWLTSIRNKCWDRDISGLREEIDNLREHRVQAYQRLRSEMDVMMTSIVAVLPTPLQTITTRVVGIATSPIGGSPLSSADKK